MGLSEAMFTQTNSYLDNLKRDYQFGGIAFLYMWDIIRDTFEEINYDPASYDSIPVPGTDLYKVWETYQNNPWGGFDVEQADVVNWLSAEDLIQEWVEEDN